MKFSYNWLQSFFKSKLAKPEKLAELLTIHSFEVSQVKKIGKDHILDIDVLPNRAPDCFSHLGIAREIAAILNLKLKIPNSKLQIKSQNLEIKNFLRIEVRDKIACPRYTVRVITDVKVGSSPKWLKDRLKVCGLRPINNIVDIANYVMLETGQPLHAFDLDKVSGIQNQKDKSKIKNIIVRKAKKDEKIITLDGEKYNLDEDILVIADSKEVLAIAGIKGGKKAEIDQSTKNVILESANFEPRMIRRASKKLNLRTDASLRFEHGIDPNLTEFAINRLVYLIQEIADGKITREIIDIYPKKILPKKIRLDLDYVKSLLGIEIPKKEIVNILKKLDFEPVEVKLAEVGPPQVEVIVPTRRLDISIPEDLIEEISRIKGFENIPAVFPTVVSIPSQKNLDIFWEDMIKNILKEVGFTEVYNYSFIGEKEVNVFGYKEKLPKKTFDERLVEIENPISEEQKYLRPSLIPNLLKNVKENFKYFETVKIFEMGKIFSQKKNLAYFKEKKVIAGLIAKKQTKTTQFYELKGVVDSLLEKLGVDNVWYDTHQPTSEGSEISVWHPKKSAEIKVNHTEIGFLGDIRPVLLQGLKIEGEVCLFELDFEKLKKLLSEEIEYRPISKFPAAIRDLAILVPYNVRVEEVLNIIEVAGGVFLRDVDLFDIYEGEELPHGKKNLAFHLTYQAEDHTLTSKEIDELQNKIIKAIEKNPEWQVRK